MDLQLYRPFAREDRLTSMTREKFHVAVERALLELADELSDAVRTYSIHTLVHTLVHFTSRHTDPRVTRQ